MEAKKIFRFKKKSLLIVDCNCLKLLVSRCHQFGGNNSYAGGMPFRQALTSCRDRSAGMSHSSRKKNWKSWMSQSSTKENEAPPQKGPMSVADKRLWISRAFFLWWWPTMHLVAMPKELSIGHRSNYSPLFGTPEAASQVHPLILGHQNKRHKNLKQRFRRPIRLWDWSKEMMKEFSCLAWWRKCLEKS